MVKKENIVQQKKEHLKKLAEGAVMGLAFFVMFGMIIIPGLREDMATTLDVVLGPLSNIIDNFLIVILLLSVITGIYTSIIQKYTMNWEVMAKSKELQKQMREIQKEYIEAKKEDNKHKIKKIENKRAEVMRKQTEFSGEMMKQQMKPMAYIVIITIPVFMWMWEYVSGAVIFPLIGPIELTATFVFGMPYWVLWYMVCSIPLTQVVRKGIGIKSTM
jgi:uncharacterized membrane protein (DUF106 family)